MSVPSFEFTDVDSALLLDTEFDKFDVIPVYTEHPHSIADEPEDVAVLWNGPVHYE